jgi:hypothetical protein
MAGQPIRAGAGQFPPAELGFSSGYRQNARDAVGDAVAWSGTFAHTFE